MLILGQAETAERRYAGTKPSSLFLRGLYLKTDFNRQRIQNQPQDIHNHTANRRPNRIRCQKIFWRKKSAAPLLYIPFFIATYPKVRQAACRSSGFVYLASGASERRRKAIPDNVTFLIS